MKEALQEVVREVPYATFVYALRYANYLVPENIGGGCVYQGQRLVEKLNGSVQRAGFVPTGVVNLGPHHAVWARNDDGLFLMDPYAMHLEPFSIDAAMNGDAWQVSGSIRSDCVVALAFDEKRDAFDLHRGFRKRGVDDDYGWSRIDGSYLLANAGIEAPDISDPAFIKTTPDNAAKLRYIDDADRVVSIVYDEVFDALELRVDGERAKAGDIAYMLGVVDTVLKSVGDRFDNMDAADLVEMMRYSLRVRADL